MVTIVGKDSSLVEKITCKNCSSILEYLPIDVETKSGTSYGGYWETKTITCPCCSKKVTISSR